MYHQRILIYIYIYRCIYNIYVCIHTYIYMYYVDFLALFKDK